MSKCPHSSRTNAHLELGSHFPGHTEAVLSSRDLIHELQHGRTRKQNRSGELLAPTLLVGNVADKIDTHRLAPQCQVTEFVEGSEKHVPPGYRPCSQK